jgi:hypothetical protein
VLFHSASQPTYVRVPVAMTRPLSAPPESSYVTRDTLAEAEASSTDEPPETLAPPAGTSTVLVGGGLSTVRLTGELVSLSPSAAVATLTSL